MTVLPVRTGGDAWLADRMRAAQVETLYRNVTTGVLGAGFSAAVLAACLGALGAARPGVAAGWAGIVCLCAAVHVGLRLRRRRAVDADAAWRWWGAAFAVVALAEGLAWGWASVRLVAPGRYDQQLVVMLVSYAVAGGAISAFGSFLPAFWCIYVPTTVPFTVASLLEGRVEHVAATLLSLIYVVAMAAVGLRWNAEYSEGLRLRFEVDGLAAALLGQKEAAEQANLAKSRFLAAASHDLRQPVHALSLSVGALQGMAMPAEARVLVGQIEASVEALDGLFTALLDISRLDAAVVVPQERAFALQPVLERVCREHAPDALRKGVRLRLVPCSLAVRTDPVLFERLLRNLVANAVRYTDAGRVVVGCRRGASVSVEVWDTGRGIPAALHERVFDEFFQVGNQERDRSAGLGLGLGLAIVRRLARLLDIGVSLRSAEGRGSVFRLAVARAAAPELESAGGWRVAARAVGGALILVIDDEAAIRAAMGSLLVGWGHRVIAAGSGAEMLARLADCAERPGLLICDYRLRGGENGIATVERLQSEYNEDLPAILITGDTAPERLAEARASGLVLLHKPVEHGALRRVIEGMLAAEAGALVGSDGSEESAGSVV